MTRIQSINKLHISKYYRFEVENENKKNTTYFHSNNSIIYTSQFHATYGSIMPGRYFSSRTGYRYGFNGKEMDNEVKGVGNQVAYELRIYDARLGRWLSTDPRESEYAWQSTYAYYTNSPIAQIDYMGGGSEEPAAGKTDAAEKQATVVHTDLCAEAYLNIITPTAKQGDIYTVYGNRKLDYSYGKVWTVYDAPVTKIYYEGNDYGDAGWYSEDDYEYINRVGLKVK